MWNWKVLIIFLVAYLRVSLAFECGTKKVDKPQGLIAGKGSKDAYAGQWPWIASLYCSKAEKYFCGASIINEWTLLTAAHCKKGCKFSIKALLGRFDITNSTEEHWIERKIVKVTIHKDYERTEETPLSEADIALLIMDEKVQFNDYIQPICLPSSSVNVFQSLGVVVGHGQLVFHNYNPSPTPKYVEMSAVGLGECLTSDSFANQIVSTRSFCAKGNESVPCKGDSGGGYFNHDFKTSQWTVLGIVSYSMNDQCNSNELAVFSRISLFMDFIIENAKGEVNFLDNFKCKNGSKIAFWKKCNGNFDCSDNDDEIDCVNGTITENQGTFTALKNITILNSNHTIRAPRNEFIKTLIIDDQREVKYLPIRVGEIFPNLVEYKVDWCAIKTVKSEHFVLLIHLKVLSLRKNWIESINYDALQELSELEELHLSKNKITSLSKDLFKTPRKLKKIMLNNNLITELPTGLFENLFVLEILNLKHNHLKTLRSALFLDNKNLQQILLLGNSLKSIDEEIFDAMTMLTLVDLRCNECFNKNFNDFKNNVKEFKKLARSQCIKERC